LTEALAIRRAQAGDGEAFNFLYEMHKRRVYSLCLRMMKDPTAAEDLAQDAFLQLFRKISSFRGDSAFTTWLHRMTVNTVLMHLRKKKLPSISLDEVMEPHDDDSPRMEFGSLDPSLAGAIDRVTLERVVAELPPGYKEFFILHDVEGFEHNEIADKLGCSVGNSKSQLHKARLKLRHLLKEEAKKRLAAKTRMLESKARDAVS